MPLNVVLHEPQIPQNTGNIARTCAAVGARLHLIEPLGFSTSDRYLRRAGLDYWHLVDIHYYAGLEEFLAQYADRELILVTKKAARVYTDLRYRDECCLLFGKETTGLPEPLLRGNLERCVRIPMRDGARSLNLSNSVAVVVFEALRQLGFPELASGGRFASES